MNIASVESRIYPIWSWWLGIPGYLGVKGALWGPFNPEYKPLQLTGKLVAVLGDKILIILLSDRRVNFVKVP